MARDPSATPQDDGFFTIFYGDIVMVEENNSSTPPPLNEKKVSMVAGLYSIHSYLKEQIPI